MPNCPKYLPVDNQVIPTTWPQGKWCWVQLITANAGRLRQNYYTRRHSRQWLSSTAEGRSNLRAPSILHDTCFHQATLGHLHTDRHSPDATCLCGWSQIHTHTHTHTHTQTHMHAHTDIPCTETSWIVAKPVLKQQSKEIFFMPEMWCISLQLTPWKDAFKRCYRPHRGDWCRTGNRDMLYPMFPVHQLNSMGIRPLSICQEVKSWNSSHPDSPVQSRRKKNPFPVAIFEGKILYYCSFVMLHTTECEILYNLL